MGLILVKYSYIDNQSALERLCSAYLKSDVLAIDTEFVRERTFSAKLGLLQAYDGDTLALIDPLSVDDLNPFWALLTNPSIVKVIHAGSEDFEVFRNYGSVTPQPIFDCQVAAALAELGSSLGYGKLIDSLLDITLDKGESRTNWLARPLRDAQLEYAANDVYYLHQAYFKLLNALEANGKLDICQQECLRLANKYQGDEVSDEERYQDISGAWQLTPLQLAVLQQLAAWRYNEALKRDLALGFVLKDADLMAIAKNCPRQLSQLKELQQLHPMAIKRYGKKILTLVDNGLAQQNLPQKLTRLMDFPRYKQTFKAIKSMVEQAADRVDIPKEMIASKKLIHEVLSFHWQDTEETRVQPVLFTGWRNELVGQEINEFLTNS